ncbi:MAG TPA: MFS transporter [Bryobacteraceae bacterium]|nr:MFS transporter [Bryobacteraceae bacterium]
MPRRYVILILLSLGMVVAYLDRINLSVALAVKDFTDYFQLTDPQRGALNSAFFWSYAAMQIPAGWLVDRYGSKYPFAISFLFWSLASAATSLVETARQLFALRFVLGVCEAAVTPASMRWIRYHFREKERGMAVGIYTSGSKIGSAIAAPFTAALIHYLGWRGMFFALGLGCLLWLVPWLILAEDDRKQSRSQPVESGPKAPPLSFLDLVRSPAIWGIIVGTFCYSYFYLFYMTWLPAYFLEQRHLSLKAMGIYSAASFAGMAVVAAPAGLWADRIIARGRDAVTVRRMFTITGMLIASCEVVGAFSKDNSVALLFAVVSMAGLGFTTANYWALTQALTPPNSIGRVIGIQNCANNISGIVASILTGWLKEKTGSFEAPMVAILVFLLIGVAAYHFLAREEFRPGQPSTILDSTPSNC